MDAIGVDGQGLVIALRIFFDGGRIIDRSSFDEGSIAGRFFELLNGVNGSLALIGGVDGVAERARIKIESRYPRISVVLARTGYFKDSANVFNELLDRNPRAVIVGMGAPKQEEFLFSLRATGFKGVVITCGGFFDQFVSSEKEYYPGWIDKMNMRWLYRLIKSPRKIGKRLTVEYLPFYLEVVKQLCLSLIRVFHGRASAP